MSTLWMGDLEGYMDERFVRNAFAAAGNPPQSAKIIVNKLTGTSAGYCFVEFPNPQSATNALTILNGIMIPGASPPKRFKLNWATYGKDTNQQQGPEFSIFVGDLTEEVTDSILFEFFRKRFPSCKAAKVVMDTSGISRGYGFVRFTNENEQLRSMTEMHGARGCGGKAVRVSAATPKKPPTTSTPTTTTQYNPTSQQYLQQYQQYQQYLAAWQASYQQQAVASQYYTSYTTPYNNTAYQHDPQVTAAEGNSFVESTDDFELEQTTVDPNEPLDTDAENKLLIDNEKALFYELEESRWRPVESVMDGPTTLVA